ncbi:Zn-dependent hydrolase [Clostridium tetani]|uniref:Zn-dependent hydrolase n=1 Tax=Clostridium tetani TaxID=1513 RepID=A0ABY0ENK7_CLOTA|nr:Zn-dependent hydrolase [Clostridium tetani]CDI48987.1 allantoate amidohydrolase [Clostridium tetani 12124569]KHO39547.1 allantoate amidohydrolase [Clostridium tetani]RXI38540.1 Zn-dependent hydrolase [Clostridium tetani]RXI55346.1 Zn-dependent hydrolase [Clostridium tetani]RXI68417.1 Zn-dependent hydrolase [Clostridium tetani]
MISTIEDMQYLENIFNKFYAIGTTDNGGVTRLGYSQDEDEMHNVFKLIGEEEGFQTYEDEVGNTYVLNNQESSEHYLIGSHLDSVINGGRYDGVAGVIAGLMILKWAKEDNVNIPIKVVAFRCEESSNFGMCTIGSGLITNKISKHDIENLVSQKGKTLKEIFEKKGYRLNPKKISNIKQYLELHIEQGKVLEEYGVRVGVVSDIAGPRRFNIYIQGEAEHSGATPMNMRYDALCAASELILEIEKIGKKQAIKKSVATVGVVNNSPNVLNVIPGEVKLGVDIRGIDKNSLNIMEEKIREIVENVSKKRNIEIFIEKISELLPVKMSPYMQERLTECCKKTQISYKILPSGAGHDAMVFPQICDTALIFIPCSKGISHNKNEFTSLESILDGTKVMYEYLKGEIYI